MANRRSTPVNRHWTGFNGTTLALGAGTSGVTLQAAQYDRETLMRTRGNLVAYTDAIPTDPSLAIIAVGFCIVPEGTGTTVLWSPFNDADAPWFYYEVFSLGYEEPVADVIQIVTLSGFRSVIDSKAMRRIRNSEVQMVVENATIAGAVTLNLSVTGRLLSQE